jgi:hypothetical protein
MKLLRTLGLPTTIVTALACSSPSGPSAEDVGGTYVVELSITVQDSGAHVWDPVHLRAACRGTWEITGTISSFRGRYTITGNSSIFADTSLLCRPLSGSLRAGPLFYFSCCEGGSYLESWEGFLSMEGSPDPRTKLDVITGCTYQHLVESSSTPTVWDVHADRAGGGPLTIRAVFYGIFECATNLLRGRYKILLYAWITVPAKSQAP